MQGGVWRHCQGQAASTDCAQPFQGSHSCPVFPAHGSHRTGFEMVSPPFQYNNLTSWTDQSVLQTVHFILREELCSLTCKHQVHQEEEDSLHHLVRGHSWETWWTRALQAATSGPTTSRHSIWFVQRTSTRPEGRSRTVSDLHGSHYQIWQKEPCWNCTIFLRWPYASHWLCWRLHWGQNLCLQPISWPEAAMLAFLEDGILETSWLSVMSLFMYLLWRKIVIGSYSIRPCKPSIRWKVLSATIVQAVMPNAAGVGSFHCKIEEGFAVPGRWTIHDAWNSSSGPQFQQRLWTSSFRLAGRQNKGEYFLAGLQTLSCHCLFQPVRLQPRDYLYLDQIAFNTRQADHEFTTDLGPGKIVRGLSCSGKEGLTLLATAAVHNIISTKTNIGLLSNRCGNSKLVNVYGDMKEDTAKAWLPVVFPEMAHMCWVLPTMD